MQELLIKNVTLQEMEFLLSLAKEEGWNPGLYDALPFYQTDPNGFFIGEINNEKIGCISSVAYNDDYGFMGFYIITPKFRGKGYGLQLWNHAVNYLGNRCIGLDGVVDQQENYKKSHFKLYYRNIRFKGTGKSGADTGLTPIEEVPLEKLFEYDALIYGFTRKEFLKPWLEMPNSRTLVKLESGKVKGYGTIRKCYDGYKIGPLFAEKKEIAKEIYYNLCNKTDGGSVFLDVSESNPEAVSLAKELKLEKVFETARMYTKSPPDQQLQRVFGVTTFELG